MPVYVVTDPEGKEWEVEGQGSQEDALKHFQSQWKPSGGGQTQAAPMPAQNGTPSRLESAAASVIPGGQSYEAYKAGASPIEKLGAGSGDLLNAALYIGSGGGWGLAKQAALNAGAGALAPELAKASEFGSEKGGQIAKQAAPGALQFMGGPLGPILAAIYKNIPENTSSMPLQIAKNLPETVGQTAGAFLPQAGLALLGKAAGKVSGKALEPSPAAQKLESLGGETTAAQMLPPGILKKVLGGYETTMARTNPLLANKFENIDIANAEAVAKAAKQGFGADILEPQSAVNTGKALGGQLENILNKRTEAYAPALEKLKGQPSKALGESIINSVDALRADETLSPRAVNAFKEALAQELEGSQTALGIDKALTRIKDAYKSKLAPGESGLSGQQTHDFNTMLNTAKEAYYAGLGEVGPDIKALKGGYAQATEGAAPLSEAISAREGAPERVGEALLRGGSENIQNLVREAGPEGSKVQQLLARAILESSKGEKGISSKKLSSALTKNRALGLQDSGALLAELQDLAATAGQNEIGTLNPSGTFNQAAKSGHYAGAGAALLNPQILAGLIGKLGLDLGYAYGAKPALGAAAGALNQVPKASFGPLQALNMQQAAERAKRLAGVQ